MSTTYQPQITIVSGGQTGVDRAALDFAIANELPHAGWCPQGRRAEDGPIGPQYNLQETPSRNYPVRTRKNIVDSDATLIIAPAIPLTGGTSLTEAMAKEEFKPLLIITDDEPLNSAQDRLTQWIAEEAIQTLNVAGPRAAPNNNPTQRVQDILSSII